MEGDALRLFLASDAVLHLITALAMELFIF